MVAFLRDFWEFLKIRKRFWLLPVCIIVFLLVGLIVLTQGSGVAPFIYVLF